MEDTKLWYIFQSIYISCDIKFYASDIFYISLLVYISDWSRLYHYNVVTGILDSPHDADGVDTFYLGDFFDYSHYECEVTCEQQTGCVAYSQFPFSYPSGEFESACIGRSSKYDVLEPDEFVLSGVFTGMLQIIHARVMCLSLIR